jgi:hypothetical protein
MAQKIGVEIASPSRSILKKSAVQLRKAMDYPGEERRLINGFSGSDEVPEVIVNVAADWVYACPIPCCSNGK